MYYLSRCLFFIALTISNPLAYCGEITINFAPPSTRFGSADCLHISELDDVFVSALGYTPKNPSWHGLTLTTPFGYPDAAVLFVVKEDGLTVPLEGWSYCLREDYPIGEAYQDLISLIGARARRPTHFEAVNSAAMVEMYSESIPVPKTESLDDNPLVIQFLREMSSLPGYFNDLESKSSIMDEGQDVILVQVDSFAPLIKQFGLDSPQAKEASGILRESLVEAINGARKFYDDRVVVATVQLDREGTNLVRRTRAAPGDGSFDDFNKTEDYNLAVVYSEDYPVVFNIVVILSIILIVAIIATSVSMAFMDPGRDSIIYRMTNPRMKKDQ